jgi:hypothetical protein
VILHGTLHGYILSDIFGLLVRQKASGSLSLFTDGKGGVLLFREGMITDASNNEELLSEKLFYLISDTCHYPLSETGRLFTAFRDDITGLCEEIVRRNLLTREALKAFSISVTEDIICRFFLWRSGTYDFSSDPTVDAGAICPSWLKIAPEKIAMEAIRRFDEWRRIRLRVDPDAIYAPIPGPEGAPPANLHLHISPSDLVLSRIDGKSPVASIIRTSCLTKYKTYEAITSLLSEKRIRPIERRSLRPATPLRKVRERRTRRETISGRTTLALCIVIGIIVLTLVTGIVVLHGFVLAGLEYRAAATEFEIPAAEAGLKAEIASLCFDALKGSAPSRSALVQMGLLTRADLRPLYEIRTLGLRLERASRTP